MKKKPNDEDRRLAKEANILAGLAMKGDKTAKRKLERIIQDNWYVAKLVSRLRRKISQLEAKDSKVEKEKYSAFARWRYAWSIQHNK